MFNSTCVFCRQKRYHNLETYNSKPLSEVQEPEHEEEVEQDHLPHAGTCDCLSCFPYLGDDSSKGKKCKKLQKAEEQRQLNEKPTVSITIEPVAGPSGLNKPKYPSKPTAAHSLSYASKYNIQDSDDYDSDEHDFNVTSKKVVVPTALFCDPITTVKSDALAAPDLQLDCFSDDDDDVIFVEENKNVPIDLTNSDSDDDAQIISPPIDTVSIDEGNGSNSNDSMAVNPPDHSSFYNTIGNLFNYDDR